MITTNNWFQLLIFTRTKHGANRLAEFLNKHGVTALAIHGNKSQGARTRALSEFKSGALQALVATDIAARGLDIEQLPHVINFDLPHVPEDYVHRIGRTGRAGATGEAISLVCADDKPLLTDIERVIRRQVPREIVAGFEPNPHERAEPIVRQRGQGKPEHGQRERQHHSPQRRSSQGQPRKNTGEQTCPSATFCRSRTEEPREQRKAHAKPKHPRPASPPRRADRQCVDGAHQHSGTRYNHRIAAGAKLAPRRLSWRARPSEAPLLKSGTTLRRGVLKQLSTICYAVATIACTAAR